MAKVIFSFDTEDYISPGVDDFTKRIGSIFDRRDLTASFMMVAERARVLVARGRMDVIETLGRHEIGYHSTYHSLHPNVAEYLDEIDGWSDGVGEFLAREQEGVSMVRQIFGRRKLRAAVPAGYSWAPQMVCGYGMLGIPIQSGSALIPPWNHPLHYAGQLHLDYNLPLDNLLLGESWEPVPAAFEALLEKGAQTIVTLDHPTILLHREFVDSINFGQGRNPPRHEWKPAPPRPTKDSERALSHMDRLLEFVLHHPDLEPCTYQSIAERFEESPGGQVDRSTALALAEHAAQGRFCSIETNGTSFSAADQFGVLCHAVAHAKDGMIPQSVPLRRLLGPTGDVQGQSAAPVMPAKSVRQAALDVEMDLAAHVPASIRIGEHRVSPGAFLRGLGQIVRETASGVDNGAIEFAPSPPLPEESEMEGLRDLTWKDRWDIFPPDFTGENLKRHALLQSWTIRRAIDQS